MDREVWQILMSAARAAGRAVPRTGRRCQFSDVLIVRMFLWSVWHDRPRCWACARTHYSTLFRPRQLPSVAQFCRRLKTARVAGMLQAVNDYLTRSAAPARLSFLDGKPLPISFCSRDPDARVGWATKRFAKGYKLHAWASTDGFIRRFAVRPMNTGEAKVAREFAAQLPQGLVLADANYDTKHLYQALGKRGAQLLTPLKRSATTPGPLRRMAPQRRFALTFYQRWPRAYRALLDRRDQIERIFSTLSGFGGGLTTLPPWVRRWDRVTHWVSAKIAIYHARLRCRKVAT